MRSHAMFVKKRKRWCSLVLLKGHSHLRVAGRSAALLELQAETSVFRTGMEVSAGTFGLEVLDPNAFFTWNISAPEF